MPLFPPMPPIIFLNLILKNNCPWDWYMPLETSTNWFITVIKALLYAKFYALWGPQKLVCSGNITGLGSYWQMSLQIQLYMGSWEESWIGSPSSAFIFSLLSLTGWNGGSNELMDVKLLFKFLCYPLATLYYYYYHHHFHYHYHHHNYQSTTVKERRYS